MTQTCQSPHVPESLAPIAPRRILLVAPSPPPYGGMALQARLLERRLTAEGHHVQFLAANLPFPNALRFLDNLRGLRPFFRTILMSVLLWRQSAQADVIHVFAASWLYFFFVVYPAVLIGRLRSRRVVINYRGGEAARFFHYFGWAAAPVFRLASVVTAPSQFLAEVIQRRFHSRADIVPNIVELSKFRFRPRPSVRPAMVVARHLEKTYDVESVLKAFRSVQQHHPEASLRIAGSGSEQPRLEALASEWNLQNVEFLGHVAHDHLPSLYDQCDILLNGSHVDNFPGALLEGSAAGLVVVSTAAPGIAFMYEHGKTGLLVEPGDWQALARAVETVLDNPPLARDLAANGATLARRCDWQCVRQSLYHTYGFASGN